VSIRYPAARNALAWQDPLLFDLSVGMTKAYLPLRVFIVVITAQSMG
jgi:hypothetical protein